MKQCQVCGMWFKNTKALNAHSRFCRRGSKTKTDMNLLLLRLLTAFLSLDHIPETIKASYVADLLKIDVETANEFLRWMKSSEFEPLVRFVLESRRRLTASKIPQNKAQ